MGRRDAEANLSPGLSSLFCPPLPASLNLLQAKLHFTVTLFLARPSQGLLDAGSSSSQGSRSQDASSSSRCGLRLGSICSIPSLYRHLLGAATFLWPGFETQAPRKEGRSSLGADSLHVVACLPELDFDLQLFYTTRPLHFSLFEKVKNGAEVLLFGAAPQWGNERRRRGYISRFFSGKEG